MSGEMVALLLGVQGGDEEAFARLYHATNPVVLRYLRVVCDGDPAPLALATWSGLLDRMQAFVADDDDDWLELAVALARQSALPSATRSSHAAPEDRTGAVAAQARSGPVADPVDEGIAVLRDCGPAVADVLAMGVVAGLGRDSIARITRQEPTEVLALVHEGQARLTVPLQTLIVALRVPGRPAEVADLPSVLPLLAAATSRAALRTTASTAAPAASDVGASAPAAGPTVADLLTWDTPGHATSSAVSHQRGGHTTPRWARVGASAATWTIALGGLGAAAAMSGLVPGILHSLFGGEDNRAVITAHGPAHPGRVPSHAGRGGTGATEPSGPQPGGQVRGEPTTERPGSSGTGDTVVVSASYLESGTATQVLMLPAVLTEPSPGSGTTAPGRSGRTPSTPTSQPLTAGGSAVTAGARTTGKDHLKHSTAKAKGRAKPAHAGTKAAGVTARPKHRVTAATSKTKAAKVKAVKAAKLKAAKVKAVKAAKLKAAKAAKARAAAVKAKAAKAKA